MNNQRIRWSPKKCHNSKKNLFNRGCKIITCKTFLFPIEEFHKEESEFSAFFSIFPKTMVNFISILLTPRLKLVNSDSEILLLFFVPAVLWITLRKNIEPWISETVFSKIKLSWAKCLGAKSARQWCLNLRLTQSQPKNFRIFTNSEKHLAISFMIN